MGHTRTCKRQAVDQFRGAKMRPWVPSGRVWRNPPSTRRAVTASTRRPGKPLMSLSAPTAASGLPGTTAGSRAGTPMLGVAAAGRTGALLQAHPPDCRRHGCRLGDQGGRHLAELLEHAPANVSEWTPPTSHRRVGAPVATTAAVRVQTVGKQPILAASKLRDRWELGPRFLPPQRVETKQGTWWFGRPP
jgi:hypothetical protein